jgi:hypothetical protein
VTKAREKENTKFQRFGIKKKKKVKELAISIFHFGTLSSSLKSAQGTWFELGLFQPIHSEGATSHSVKAWPARHTMEACLMTACSVLQSALISSL